jgi:pimeloyl-ACP methyl ester carboxylesterase/DNA-binding winged helix-turn-helix (wHTH) protein
MTGTTPERVRLGNCSFDPRRRELHDDGGQRIALRPQCIDVLCCLAAQLGEPVSKDELMRTVWPKVVVTDDSLVQCVKELRRALQDDQRRILVTEPKRGYRLIGSRTGGRLPPAAVEPAGDALESEQAIRFATAADGVCIAYADWGAGVPVVRTTFWMSHVEHDWRTGVIGPRLREIARRHRLIRYDMRGSGLSDRDVVPGDLDTQVDDLKAVVDAVGLHRFALWGPSAGAAIAVRFAGTYPERVTHLLITGGWVRGTLHRGPASPAPDLVDAYIRLISAGWDQENAAARQLLTSWMWPGATADQMAGFNELQRSAASAQQAVRAIRMLNDWDATADLPLVRCPTLVMHSPRDAVVPFEEGRMIAANIDGARLESFDSANHLPLPQEPTFAQMHRTIDAFLAQQPDGQPRPRPAPPQPRDRNPVLRVIQGTRTSAATARRRGR